jgi:hypothetical protein
VAMTAFCKCAVCGDTWDDAKGEHICCGRKKPSACKDCALTTVCVILQAVPRAATVEITECSARIPWSAVR